MRLFDLLRRIDRTMPDMTCLVADEIGVELDNSNAPEGMLSYPAASYGIVAPPWPEFWVEARTVIEDNYGKPLVVERGMLMQDATDNPVLKRTGLPAPAGTHWTLVGYGFLRMDGGEIYEPAGLVIIHLDARGYILDDLDRTPTGEFIGVPPSSKPRLPVMQATTFMPFVLRAIGALHRHVAVEHVMPTRQQRREAERKHDVMLSEHYVLHIHQKAQRRAALVALRPEPRAAQREHDVRGHFRIYTQERPLFGRISGAVWVPTHKRGAADQGKVSKDYEIHGDE